MHGRSKCVVENPVFFTQRNTFYRDFSLGPPRKFFNKNNEKRVERIYYTSGTVFDL